MTLNLRVDRAQDWHGQDTMLRVMRCLRPYLRFFSAVHLNLKKVCEVNSSSYLFTSLSRLLSLWVEGQATLNHFLLFPLQTLRQLNTHAKISPADILELIDLSKKLDVLLLDFQSDLLAHSELPYLPGVRFPPSIFLSRRTTQQAFCSLTCALLHRRHPMSALRFLARLVLT